MRVDGNVLRVKCVLMVPGSGRERKWNQMVYHQGNRRTSSESLLESLGSLWRAISTLAPKILECFWVLSDPMRAPESSRVLCSLFMGRSSGRGETDGLTLRAWEGKSETTLVAEDKPGHWSERLRQLCPLQLIQPTSGSQGPNVGPSHGCKYLWEGPPYPELQASRGQDSSLFHR